MIIKKYQGKTEEEAMLFAKKELGEGVVLMNVKNMKPKGLLRLVKRSYVEITVAKEEEREVAMRKEPAASVLPGNDLSGATVKGHETDGSALTTEARKPSMEERQLEERLNSLETLLEQKMREERLQSRDKLSEKTDIAEQDGKEAEYPRSESEKTLSMVKEILVENEVTLPYAESILEEVEKSMKEDATLETVLSHVYQRMILRFGKPQTISAGEDGVKVIFFVGTTGVGKTTTIAKIASHFIVDEKKKVALITTDTYRIAAAEQLRTYANILEIPFRVIYTPEELAEAIDSFKEFDYIMVDTAGHSQHNAEQRDRMAEYIEYAKEKATTDVYLVLAATAKYSDLRSIADTYRSMVDYKLIFTKLDETDCYGNLLNVRMYTDAELSYITCGQNVPDDIAPFDAQSIVKKLLGGN